MAKKQASSSGTVYVLAAPGKVSGTAGESSCGVKATDLFMLAQKGMSVPPAIILPAPLCAQTTGTELRRLLRQALTQLEDATGRKLDGPRPLLLAVRCSPPAALPGLMRATLNVGMNEQSARALADEYADERFACDCHGRFIASFGQQVHGIPRREFEEAVRPVLEALGTEPTSDDLRRMIAALCAVLQSRKLPLSDDPIEQVAACVEAAQASWQQPMARRQRQRLGLPGEGLAVIVQQMAFGNAPGAMLGTLRTHDQKTGRADATGRFAAHVQGDEFSTAGEEATKLSELPAPTRRQLTELTRRVEAHHRDAAELDVVIEDNEPRILLSRRMSRGPAASLEIAVDLAKRNVRSDAEALLTLDVGSLEQLLHPRVDPEAPRDVLGHGFAASPGAAAGQLAFTAEEAMQRAQAGQRVILVRPETEADDVTAMQLCAGILTSSGGMTSHAAVVARTLGLPCVSGVKTLHIDPERRRLSIGVRLWNDWITLDGTTGEVLAGRAPIIKPELSPAFLAVLEWADRHRKLRVRANADTPAEAEVARAFGAEGIGLCRTEHMFFDPRRIEHVRRMILAKDPTTRQTALDELLPMQTDDFEKLFEIMDGLPVTIRLLDMPLHEFLPAGANVQREANPMLGHRGVRLSISYPEILRMQVRAIFEAQARCLRRKIRARPMILVPLVCDAGELAHVRPMIDAAARQVESAEKVKLEYEIGVMIETPRAALLAGQLAEHAAFFSFGTNDLTQLTYGFSRDDAASYLPGYLEKRILARDPFDSVDPDGVGELVRIAVERGRKVRADLPCGVCGEHAGEPSSIHLFHRAGLDSISCSPFRVPIARLAAAQAEIQANRP